jgi:hypothetical protein
MDKYNKAEKRVPNWVEYVETGKDQFKEDNVGRLNRVYLSFYLFCSKC